MTARKNKICMVTYLQSPTELPPMFNEALSLARAGFDVDSLSFASTAAVPDREEHAPGFRTRRFRMRTRSFFHRVFGQAHPSRAVTAIQYALSYLEYVTKALGNALRSRADVYEGHDLPALLPAVLAARLRRKPAVYRAHELWSEARAKVPFAGLWRRLERLLVPLCDVVVTPEENRSRIYLEELGAKTPPLTVRNCPPYQPPLQSTRLRDELSRRGAAFTTVVLYQGLIDSMRCIEEIAEATRCFDPGVGLVIVGSGFGKWADSAAVLAPYDRIVVLPRVAYTELLSYTASADVGVLLYRNDCRNNYYCAPNKVFEYMMMGLPVIAANYPGMRALVQTEEIGLCVDPASPEEIAAGVNRLARDAAARTRMRENGIRLSRERYNWENEVRPLLETHRELAATPRGTRPVDRVAPRPTPPR